MERGQAQRTQLDHELWKPVCQDTGAPLKLTGWEGAACTEGLQTLCNQLLKHLKHTLPKQTQSQVLLEQNRTGGNGDIDDAITAISYSVDPNNSAFQNLKEFSKFCVLHCGMQQPLCTKSTQQAISNLKAKHRQLEQANRHYSNYLKIVEAAEQLQLLYKPESSQTPDEEIIQIKAGIAKRYRDIAAIKNMRKQVRRSSTAMESKIAKLQTCFRRTLAQLRNRETALFRGAQVRQSLCTKIRVAEVKTFHLQRTNIFNDSFFIWHQGPYATINGNRLGRLPTSSTQNQQVDWPEVNAAWGCAALLLHLIGAYHSSKSTKGSSRFSFKEYTIRPMGSTSTVIWRPKNKAKELFYGGGWGIFSRKNYCDAMQGFLSCLQDLYEHIRLIDPSARIPYDMCDEIIGSLSIRNLGDLVKWTEACKYLLTNLKWLVAWTAKI